MLKIEWSAESKGKLSHLFIPSKTQVPEFAMEYLPLGRIAALVPEFAVKDLPLGRTLMMMIYIYISSNLASLIVWDAFLGTFLGGTFQEAFFVRRFWRQFFGMQFLGGKCGRNFQEVFFGRYFYGKFFGKYFWEVFRSF